jgi:hypothetical protein
MGVVVAMLVAYAYFLKMPLAEIVPLITDGDSGIDPGCIAGNLHSCARAWRSGLSKTRRVADAFLGGG